jgi:diadenosine tetraphosphate (Ap4A) HIT family hydrolase
MTVSDCEFCDIEAFRVFGSPVFIEHELCLFGNSEREDEGALRGSGIIVPKAHRRTVFDLTPEEVSATFALLKEAKVQLDERYAPDGYNVGWNCEASAGQVVFHAHLHVIPRFADEPYAGRGIRSWLKQDENRRPAR